MGGPLRQVQRPATDERSAVIDADDDGAALVGDLDAGADGSRVSIAAGTGEMTITPKGGLLVRLPYAGAMSRYHGWGKYTECYAEDAPCADGGIYLYITPAGSPDGVECTAR
jgi:hypothetical protein